MSFVSIVGSAPPPARCMIVHTRRTLGVRTNIVLDEALVKTAFRFSRARTKKELVHEALRELIRLRSRKPLLAVRGKIRFAAGYDHKPLRASR